MRVGENAIAVGLRYILQAAHERRRHAAIQDVAWVPAQRETRNANVQRSLVRFCASFPRLSMRWSRSPRCSRVPTFERASGCSNDGRPLGLWAPFVTRAARKRGKMRASKCFAASLRPPSSSPRGNTRMRMSNQSAQEVSVIELRTVVRAAPFLSTLDLCLFTLAFL